MVGFLPWLFFLFVEYLNHHSSDLSTLEERLFSHVHGICMGSSVGPCLPSSLKEHLQLLTTANTQRACSRVSGETFTSAFHLTVEALGSPMCTTTFVVCGMWILGIQSQILTPVWQACYTLRSSSCPSFLFFYVTA